MKIKVLTQIKPVHIHEGEFTDKDNKILKYYQATAICGVDCDKISVKPDVAPTLAKYINYDIKVWLEVDTNGNSKPKIIEVEEEKKARSSET